MIDFARAESYFDTAAPAAAAGGGTVCEPAVEDRVLAPLVTVVSASGGTGRSTIALLASYLAAAAGVDTVLLEGDLQFGDYGFWLGLDDGLPDVSAGAACVPADFGEYLHVCKAPAFPEAAESVSDIVAAQVPSLRARADLVVADTGSFWSGLTADLVLQSNLVLLVMDQRPASIAGAIKAAELCGRIGVPSARIVVVYNRWTSKSRIGAEEVRRGFDADEVFCVPDGRSLVEELLGTGAVDELVGSDNACVHGVRELLAEILPRVGRLYADAPIRHRGGRFR